MEENQIHIPEGWEINPLKDLMISKSNKAKQVKSSEYISSGSYPIIDQSDKFICGYWDELKNVIFEELPITVFGDHTRHTKFIDFPFVCGADGTQLIKPKNDIDDKFFYFLVCNSAKLIGNHGYDRHFKHLKNFQHLLPKSKNEQTQIATILTKVDDAITQTEQLIAKYTRIKTGLMQDLLTKGIETNPEITTSDLKGIAINTQFKQCKLENITKVRQGFQIAISKRKKEEGANRFIYITVQYLNNPKKYLEFIENPPENVICTADEILFTRTGNTGQIVRGIKGVFHNNFFKVSFAAKEITREYLMLFLNWEPVQDLIKELAGTTTIPDMKHKDFYDMPIFFPSSLDEQQNITDIINSSNESILVYQNELSKLQSLKTGLMQDLLSGKVRVNHLIKETESV